LIIVDFDFILGTSYLLILTTSYKVKFSDTEHVYKYRRRIFRTLVVLNPIIPL